MTFAIGGILTQTQSVQATSLTIAPTVTGGSVGAALNGPNNNVALFSALGGQGDVSFTNAASLAVGTVTGNAVNLQAAGNLSQAGASSILASRLDARATAPGTVALTNAANKLGTLSGGTNSGTFKFANAQGFTIGAPGIVAGTAKAGDGDIELTALTGGMVVAATLAAESDTIRLDAVNGKITQQTGAETLTAATVVWNDKTTPISITTVEDNAPLLTGTVPSGGLTNDATPTISGTAGANSTVTVFLNGTAIAPTAVADGLGNWSLTTSPLADATYAITARATNTAGKSGLTSAAYSITIDTAIPTINVLTTPPFSTSLLRVNDLGIAVTSVPINFTVPVTGVTMAAFELSRSDRPLVIRDVRVTGSGADYIVTIPASLTSPSGIYTLKVKEDTGIQDVNAAATMASPSFIYWGKDRSLAPTVLESAGFVTLAHDAAGALYANDIMITSGGPVNYQNMAALGWTAVAAEVINGFNTLVWRHASGNLHLWRLSGSWQLVSSEGWYAPGSPEYYATETALGMDLDGDATIGAPLTVIESAGGVTLASDTAGLLYANGSLITLGGNPVNGNDMTALGWTPVAVDTIGGVNTLVWRHASGNLHLWRLSGSWAHVVSEGWYAPGSVEYYATEAALRMDLDGDTVVGAPLTVIESAGSVTLTADTAGLLYADGSLITLGGNPVNGNDMTALGWTPVAVDTIGGVNTLVWRHASGNLHLWRLSTTWAHVVSEGWYAPGSPEYYATETDFGMDLDGDTVVGAPLTVIESAGSVSLASDAAGLLYAGGNLITLGGNPVNGHQMAALGWTAVAVDTIGGVNTLVWRHASGNLHLWRLSGSWAHVASEGWYAPGSPEYRALETAFGMDLDGSGTIGA